MGRHAAAAAKVAAAPRTANSRESLCAETVYALAGLVAYEPRNQQSPQGGKLLNLRSNKASYPVSTSAVYAAKKGMPPAKYR